MSSTKRTEAEHLALLRELHVCDVQLMGREEAHVWQADALRAQIEELRAQMRSGNSVAMAAAVAAADARSASEAEVAKMRDQVAKLRSQVARLKSENERLLSNGGGGGGGAGGLDGAPDWQTTSGMSVASSVRAPLSHSTSHANPPGGLISMAECEERIAKAIQIEQQRQLKHLDALVSEKQRLTNLSNQLRTDKTKLGRELAASREDAAALAEKLQQTQQELSSALDTADANAQQQSDMAAERERSLRAELTDAETTMSEQRALIAALVGGDSAAVASLQQQHQHEQCSDDAGRQEAGRDANGSSLSVSVPDDETDAALAGPSGHTGSPRNAADESEKDRTDDVMETVKMLRQRQGELEASEERLSNERDIAMKELQSTRTKLHASSSMCSSLKQQLASLKHQMYSKERSEREGHSGGDERGGLGPGLGKLPRDDEPEEGSERYMRDLDTARRTVEAQRTQMRTQQSEHLKCARELRTLRGKVDGLRASCEAAKASRQHAEETLNVQKVATQAMLQRLQSRSNECTMLQRQLSARAVELVHARESMLALQATMQATQGVLAGEIYGMERWIFGPERSSASSALSDIGLGDNGPFGGLGGGSLYSYGASSTAKSPPGSFRSRGAGGAGSSAGDSFVFTGSFGGAAAGRHGGSSAPATPRGERGGGAFGGSGTPGRSSARVDRHATFEDDERGGGGGGSGSKGGGGSSSSRGAAHASAIAAVNGEAFMAKELIQVRHELEASKRVSSEYAERTRAAEKRSEKAKEAMLEAKHELSRLKETHERVLSEVQVQRNRVAKLRLTVRRYEKGEIGRSDEYYDEGPSSPNQPLPVEERPGWNNDVVVRHPNKHVREEFMKTHTLSLDYAGAARGGSIREGSASVGGAGGSEHHVRHGEDGVHGNAHGSEEESFVAGGRQLASVEAASREVHSLQHLLATARKAQEKAERAADQRQKECEKLQALIQEADTRRDEQAKAAEEAHAAASMLRQQVQLQREKVDGLLEEKSKLNDAQVIAVQVKEQRLNVEWSASTFALAIELKDLEEALSLSEERRKVADEVTRAEKKKLEDMLMAGTGGHGPSTRGGPLRSTGGASGRGPRAAPSPARDSR